METQIFDLSKPLALRYDKVAYLVDAKNVELYRQYIEKYCGNLELEWFEEAVMSEIHEREFILYFVEQGFVEDGNHPYTEAYTDGYTIYYLTAALMPAE